MKIFNCTQCCGSVIVCWKNGDLDTSLLGGGINVKHHSLLMAVKVYNLHFQSLYIAKRQTENPLKMAGALEKAKYADLKFKCIPCHWSGCQGVQPANLFPNHCFELHCYAAYENRKNKVSSVKFWRQTTLWTQKWSLVKGVLRSLQKSIYLWNSKWQKLLTVETSLVSFLNFQN